MLRHASLISKEEERAQDTQDKLWMTGNVNDTENTGCGNGLSVLFKTC